MSVFHRVRKIPETGTDRPEPQRHLAPEPAPAATQLRAVIAERPVELNEALTYSAGGNVPVVWKLDRLARSLENLIKIIACLNRRGIDFRSLTEGIGAATVAGRLTFPILGAFGQFERDIIRERTVAGFEAAGVRG
ncbi:recombinase family protein (plasmid) [Skermanella rosea]|uniref:recombinase family protein n=1 Tax=Skermanella rosea TaxID=1817965 RepID=UPI0019312F87|nr:recombinase family protein [Skermanella rosea]UEM06747.1 recombinase family protein [Skermanella rosea]